MMRWGLDSRQWLQKLTRPGCEHRMGIYVRTAQENKSAKQNRDPLTCDNDVRKRRGSLDGSPRSTLANSKLQARKFHTV
jgi:hypothetical protein